MDGSFLVVSRVRFPTDSEHGFPFQLKGIGTAASEILPKKDRLGRLASRAGAGQRQAGAIWDRVGCAHVASGRDVRASVGWLAAANEERPPGTEASARVRNHGLGSTAVTPGQTCRARSCGSGTALS